MALTLNGTNQWPSSRDLIRIGEGRSLGTRRTLTEIFERIGDALADTREDVLDYRKDHPEFADVADKMMAQWEIGRASLTVQG
jgi:hypothetical protein